MIVSKPSRAENVNSADMVDRPGPSASARYLAAVVHVSLAARLSYATCWIARWLAITCPVLMYPVQLVILAVLGLLLGVLLLSLALWFLG